MSNLDRILKLAGFEEGTQSPQQARELKAEQAEDAVEEAVGDSAEPFYRMQDEFAGGEADGAHKVLIDELVRYMSGDQLEDFVSDFERHHDLVGDMEEAYIEGSDKDVSDEEREKAMKRAFAKSDEPERGEKRKKVSLKKAPWEESVEPTEPSTEEGNEFTGKLAKAKASGKKEFEVDGKKYKVESEEADTDAEELEEEVEETNEVDESVSESCGTCGCDMDNPKPDCDCDSHTESVNESPTMNTTQMVIMMKNAGLSEEAISEKLNEWANTPDNASEVEPREHGEAYDFAQGVNLSLKRYLDAEDMKVQVTEHKVEDMKSLYQSKKNK